MGNKARQITKAKARTLQRVTNASTSIVFEPQDSSRNLTSVAMTDFGDIGYLAINPKGTAENYAVVSFTGWSVSGTQITITGVTFLELEGTGTSAASYDFPAGTDVIITDNHHWLNNFVDLGSAQTIDGVKTFTDYPQIADPNTPPTQDAEFATKKYADDLAFAGANLNKIVVDAVAGETVAENDIVYFDETDEEWKLASATFVNQADYLVGLAMGAGTNGNAIDGGVMIQGIKTGFSGLDSGEPYFMSDTAGDISLVAGTVFFELGYAQSATQLYFFPKFKSYITKNQKDALQGTEGTPSNTNRYVTDDDTATTSTANDVVRGNGSGEIDNSWFNRQDDFFLPSYEAGENLVVGDILKLTDTDNDSNFVLEKLRGVEIQLSFPQALGADGEVVWLTDTLVMIAESNSSNTSLDVRAYTYTESTGALTLIDTVTVASMYATAGGKVLGARANATTGVFGTTFGGANPGKFVVVELQSGTTLVAGTPVNFLNSNRGVHAMFPVSDDVIFTVTGGEGATDFYARTYSVSSLSVSAISSSQITEISNQNNDPVTTVAAKDNSLFFLSQTDASTDDVEVIGFSINLGTNVITKGSLFTNTRPSTLTAETQRMTAVINGSSTRLFVWYTDTSDYMQVLNVSGTTLTSLRDTVIAPAPQVMFAVGQKSIFSAGASGEFIIDADTLEVKDITGTVITVSPTKFARSTDNKTFMIYTEVGDTYQVGEFDWGEIVGIAQTSTLTGEQSYVATPQEKVVNMTSLNPGMTYYLSESNPETTTFTPNNFPLYRAIDQTTAIIDQSIY